MEFNVSIIVVIIIIIIIIIIYVYILCIQVYIYNIYYLYYIADTNSQRKQEATSLLNTYIERGEFLEAVLSNHHDNMTLGHRNSSSITSTRNKFGSEIPVTNNGNVFGNLFKK